MTNDFRLKSETEMIANYSDGVPRAVTYTYTADGQRATVQYPSGESSSMILRAAVNYTISLTRPMTGSPFQAQYAYNASGSRTVRSINGSISWDDPNFTEYHYNEGPNVPSRPRTFLP